MNCMNVVFSADLCSLNSHMVLHKGYLCVKSLFTFEMQYHLCNLLSVTAMRCDMHTLKMNSVMYIGLSRQR